MANTLYIMTALIPVQVPPPRALRTDNSLHCHDGRLRRRVKVATLTRTHTRRPDPSTGRHPSPYRLISIRHIESLRQIEAGRYAAESRWTSAPRRCRASTRDGSKFGQNSIRLISELHSTRVTLPSCSTCNTVVGTMRGVFKALVHSADCVTIPKVADLTNF